MVKRLFLTPPDLPETSVKRLIEIPDSQEWYGLLNRALLLLADPAQYEQVNDTDMTPDDVAIIWYEAYVQYLTDGCMNCCDILAHNIALEQADERRVEDGIPQASYDGGETWVDIPDDGVDAIVPPLTATDGATDDDKLCNASERATIVLAEFYKQTFGAYSAGRLNTISGVGRFIRNVSNFLLDIVKTAYAGTIADFILYSEYPYTDEFTDAELTDPNKEDLRCLLFTYASVDDSGIVTFDFGAVQTNMISDVGFNPGYALNMLIAWIGAAGLNRAGNVGTATSDECCDDTWCYTFDFTTGMHGWSRQDAGYYGSSVQNGTGWHSAQSNGSGNDQVLGIKIAFTASPFTRFVIDYTSGGGFSGTAFAVQGWIGSSSVPFNVGLNSTGGDHLEDHTVSGSPDNLIIYLDGYPNTSPNTVRSITFYGTGDNPFGADNC